MRALWDDVRFAGRRLRQQPGFTAVAVVTLALGLGANIAMFTLIHAVMLRPLPVPRPGELVRLGNNDNCCVKSGMQGDFSLFSYALFKHLQAQLPEFSDLAAFQANTSLTGIRPPTGGPGLSTRAAYVSGNYFRMLSVTAAAGRVLDPADDVPGATPVMVMSYQTWVEQFGADPTLVGRAFVINGATVTLAGVAARGFFGETVRANPAGVWLPLAQESLIRGATASLIGRPDQLWLYAVGRVPPGGNVAGIDARATHALQTWLASQPLSARERTELPRQRIVTTSAAAGVQALRGSFGQSLTLLFVMSGVVLLIAAANLANLLLARADRAQAAVRAALGASSGRLVRQSLIEGVVLALAGCAGAFFVSHLVTRAMIGLAFPPDAVLPVDVAPSRAIVLFSIALAIATGALFAAAPAWAMGRTNPIDALRGLAREGADVAFMPRRSLVVLQVTLSLVLLVGAGLLSKSLSRLEQQPLGFEPHGRVVVHIDPPPMLAADPPRTAAVYASMQERLTRVPGVLAASYSLYSPMEGNNWSSYIAIAGRPIDPDNQISASWNRIGPNYFETMGTRVLRGRTITAADTPASPRVAVVNNAFVQKFLTGSDPLGARFGIGDASHANDYAVVGIVEDVKYSNAHLPTLPMFFLPAMQLVSYDTPGQRQVQARSTLLRTIELRVAAASAGLEPAIRRALADAHPDIVVTRITPIAEQISGNFRTNQLMAVLAGAYGLLALALASLGLYGVTAYGVSRRLHEIGVRLALGADRGRVVWDVLRGALTQTAVGLAVGVPLAWAGGGALTSQLFDVDGRDPLVLGAAAAALLVTAAIAAVLPARRAASVDPTRALRAQ